MGPSRLIESQVIDRLTVSGAIDSRSSTLEISRRPLLWLNVACLDAPLVAVAWQWLFARTFSVVLPSSHRAALFLTAWFIYLIDRYADSISLKPEFPKSVRQQVCLDHRKLSLAGILMIGALDAVIVFTRLDYSTIVAGLVLGAVAFCYLILNWALDKLWESVPIKELIIGVLFAAGTILGLPLDSITGPRILFLAGAIVFALLGSLNCVSIATWERNLDVSQGKHSIARCSLNMDTYTRASLVIVGLLSIIFVFSQMRMFAICLAISAFSLLALHHVPVRRDERTALADLVLLTPFLLLFPKLL